jgi:hypothetical protein
MDVVQQRSKRPRLATTDEHGAKPTTSAGGDGTSCTSLSTLLKEGKWAEAMERALTHAENESASSANPSPLALACRLGAPCELVQVILDAAPERLRKVLDSRGTPLHEAVVSEHVGPNVIRALLKADEALGTETSTRATLLQDVDGFTPLHLLIRRRFQFHIMQEYGDNASLMEILEMLTVSCPEAVVIPDRGEYEEPPIVYALKANLYAPSLGSEDATLARVERQIYNMVSVSKGIQIPARASSAYR